jgi:DNA modification methylase
VKQHFALSRGDYHWQHEPCWYAVKKGHKHNWQGARDQSTTWEVSNLNAFGANKDDERTSHSTQKPLECMARPIKNNTAKGESVYDPFLGSGTTLLACEQLDRTCYGIELDPAYCDIIVDRWVKYRKKLGKDSMVKLNGENIGWTNDRQC